MIHVTPINKFHETLNPTALNFLGDVSGSMDSIHKEGIMCNAINEILLPALKGAHEHRKDVLRISIGAFADDKIEGLTKNSGYYTVDQLLRHPISNDMLYKPGLNRGTALYTSMINGITSSLYAAQTMKAQLGVTKANALLFVLTDGLNYTNHSTRPTDVRRAIESVHPDIKLNVYLAYFKTKADVTGKQFEQIAESCGVPKENCHFWADHDASLEAQKKAFRHAVEILSRRY